MSITFNPLSKKLIELGYQPVDTLDSKKYPWKDKFRKFITKGVFEDGGAEEDGISFVSIFVKPFGYEVKISGEGGEVFNVIELFGVFVVGGVGEEGENSVIIDSFLKDFGGCEFRTREEMELVEKIWAEYDKDVDSVLEISGEADDSFIS